jgi:starch synthase
VGEDGTVRVLFATAELTPVAAVGGLAQAAAGLVAELRRCGVDVTVVMPDYGGIELAGEVVVVGRELDEAVEAALAAPYPDPASVLEHVGG